MAKTCEDELICDMAETYHVLNWRELPPRTAAVLACGLPADSRVSRKLRGEKYSLDTVLTVAILDELRWLVWARSRDAEKGKNRPKSLLRQMLEKPAAEKPTAFDSPEAFEAQRKMIMAGD